MDCKFELSLDHVTLGLPLVPEVALGTGSTHSGRIWPPRFPPSGCCFWLRLWKISYARTRTTEHLGILPAKHDSRSSLFATEWHKDSGPRFVRIWFFQLIHLICAVFRIVQFYSLWKRKKNRFAWIVSGPSRLVFLHVTLQLQCKLSNSHKLEGFHWPEIQIHNHRCWRPCSRSAARCTPGRSNGPRGDGGPPCSHLHAETEVSQEDWPRAFAGEACSGLFCVLAMYSQLSWCHGEQDSIGCILRTQWYLTPVHWPVTLVSVYWPVPLTPMYKPEPLTSVYWPCDPDPGVLNLWPWSWCTDLWPWPPCTNLWPWPQGTDSVTLTQIWIQRHHHSTPKNFLD